MRKQCWLPGLDPTQPVCRNSPERALEISRRIQLHQVTLHQRQTASGLTTLTPEQLELFADLDLPKPTHSPVQSDL